MADLGPVSDLPAVLASDGLSQARRVTLAGNDPRVRRVRGRGPVPGQRLDDARLRARHGARRPLRAPLRAHSRADPGSDGSGTRRRSPAPPPGACPAIPPAGPPRRDCLTGRRLPPDSRGRRVSRNDASSRQEEHFMPSGRLSRRNFLAGAVGASAALALPLRLDAAPAVKKGTSLRLWILKTYVEPTNKAIEASARALGREARRQRDRGVLHLRGRPDQVRGGHREQEHARRRSARDRRPRPLRRHGPAAGPHHVQQADRGRGGQAAGQRGAGGQHRRQDLRHPVVHHAGLLVRVARRVREEQGEAAHHI